MAIFAKSDKDAGFRIRTRVGKSVVKRNPIVPTGLVEVEMCIKLYLFMIRTRATHAISESSFMFLLKAVLQFILYAVHLLFDFLFAMTCKGARVNKLNPLTLTSMCLSHLFYQTRLPFCSTLC